MSDTSNEYALAVGTEPSAAAAEVVASAPLATELQRSAGVHALGTMSDEDFARQVQVLKRGLHRLDVLIENVLEDGVDVISIPGVKNKVLALPGAEKLCMMARLVPTYRVERLVGKSAGEPAVLYVVTCDLHLGSSDGPVVGQSSGSANSSEPRYRYRSAQRRCPSCNASDTIRKSKFAARGGPLKGMMVWYCFDKAGGCGAEFAPNDAAITDQKLGKVDNPDPLEMDNTLLKMASKRALVSAVKGATGGSARFTVDLDEGGAVAPRVQDSKGASQQAGKSVPLERWATELAEEVNQQTSQPVEEDADSFVRNEAEKQMNDAVQAVHNAARAKGIKTKKHLLGLMAAKFSSPFVPTSTGDFSIAQCAEFERMLRSKASLHDVEVECLPAQPA